MKKTETFTITKDFGDKTLEAVFVKQDTELNNRQMDSLQEMIDQAEKFVCVVAENAFSDALMEMLCKIREKSGVRIYAIVKDIDPPAFERLKNNCIIRSVSSVSGNYIICDRKNAFFFNSDLQGYKIVDSEIAEKLHDMFIYNFWNNAQKEFVTDKKDVAERTFDVAPAKENEKVIFNRSALDEKPYDSLLQNAGAFVLANQKSISEIIKSSSAEKIYLDKKTCENNRDYLSKKQEKEIVYSDDCIVPLCKSGGEWYLCNNNFDKPSENDGNFFFAKMEGEPTFFNAHDLKHDYSYRDAVEKQMLNLNFSPITISASDKEEKSFKCDYAEFKKIRKMSEEDRRTEFEKRNLLDSEKLSASVDFSVTMSVKKRSKDAKRDSIYDEYENFEKKLDEKLKAMQQQLDGTTQNIEAYEKREKEIGEKIAEREKKSVQLESIENEIKILLEQIAEKKKAKLDAEYEENSLKKKLNELNKKREKDKSFEKEFAEVQEKIKEIMQKKNSISDVKQEENALKEKEKNLNALKNEIKKEKALEKELEEFQQKIDAEKKRQDEAKKKKKLSEKLLLQKAETVEYCKNVSGIFEGFVIPRFDKPRYGTLYKVKGGYEYELNSDEDYASAAEEVEKASIGYVEFVISEK